MYQFGMGDNDLYYYLYDVLLCGDANVSSFWPCSSDEESVQQLPEAKVKFKFGNISFLLKKLFLH